MWPRNFLTQDITKSTVTIWLDHDIDIETMEYKFSFFCQDYGKYFDGLSNVTVSGCKVYTFWTSHSFYMYTTKLACISPN